MPDNSSSVLRNFRFILWGLVILIGIAASLVYGYRTMFPGEEVLGLKGGKFTLTSTRGDTFTEQDLKGAPSLIYFGYTYCPDVCPTTLAESVNWLKTLEFGPDRVRTIFVTVDPERDTLDNLKTYLAAFSPDIIGLRGDASQTEAAKSAFGVYSKKVEDPGSTDYLVDHTALVFLIGADGSFQGTIAFGEDAGSATAKIKRLVGG